MENGYSSSYMDKLLSAFYDNNSIDFMFIKHNKTLSLKEEKVIDIFEKTGHEYCLLYYEFIKHQMQEPYQPFLGWIREIYYKYFASETPEQFVKNAKVYPMQQETLAEYIRTGKAYRTEDILLNELTYEGRKMLDSLVNIYKYICSRVRLFVVLDKFHLTNLSGVKLMHKLIRIDCPGRFRVVATYDESSNILEYIEAEWKEFLIDMEKQGYMYEWGEINKVVSMELQDGFVPQNEQMEEYLTYARNMYFFLCYRDAEYYLNIIYEKVKHGNLSITQDHYTRLLQLLILTNIHCQDYSHALQLCEYLGSIARETNDDKLLYHYNYLCAITQFGTERMENKINVYVERCRSIAKSWNDEIAECKPQILQLLFECNFWRDIYVDSYGKYVSAELFEKLQRLGFRNILAYIYIYCFTYTPEELELAANHQEDLYYFKKGADLATEIENYDLLISAYTKNMVVFSGNEYHDYVSELYKKKLEILMLEKNPIRLIHTYNGMGYNAGVCEQYQQAEEYFSKSMEQLINLGNGVEIAVTLYNSAINKMAAREYEYASNDLLLLIKIMDILGINALPITDTAGFYGMLGICSFYIGEDYRCCYCLNRIDDYVNHLNYVKDENKYNYWVDALFMRHLLKAMMDVVEGRYEEAEAEFEQAEFMMQKDREKKFLSYVLYVQEIAKYYDVIGEEEKRQSILHEGIAFCEQNGYRLRSGILMTQLRKGHEVSRKSITLKRTVSNEEILKAVEKIALQQKYEKSQKHIEFVTIWQELLSKNKRTQDILSQTFHLLKSYFNFDGAFLVGVGDRDAWMEYMDYPDLEENADNVTKRVLNLTKEDLKKIAKYFDGMQNAILINRIQKGFFEHRNLLKIIGIHQVVTLFAAPLYNDDGSLANVLIGYVEMKRYAMPNRYLLKESDLVILEFVSEQLQKTLERLNYIGVIQKMNEKLSDMAITDQLTGLYNRQGFEKLMREWSSQREFNKVIVYLDLDNFKYYNDTFGHELGDYLLVCFSQVLRNVVEDIGDIVRYGGDEFLVILNEQDTENAKSVVENIFIRLESEVAVMVQKRIGEWYIIPEEKRLTCSAGIAACRENTDIMKTLNNADKALYYVKRSTKNNYVVWEELPGN